MSSVGIVTLNGNHNYGNRLQLYASSRIYIKLNLYPTVLLPESNLFAVDSMLWNVKKVAKCILRRREQSSTEVQMSPDRLLAFERFSSEIPSRKVGRNDLDVLANDFDFFSVGSDQVWNPDYIRYEEKWFYLSFAESKQRIALSPSIGLDTLNHRQARALKRGVSGFPSLSVREKRGAELIKASSGRDPEVICDPTLVLSVEDWKAVANDSLIPTEPYVFTYLLGGVGSEASAVLDRVTEHGRIPVISLSDRQKPGEPDAGPAEFISLVDHASYVITDSFHAAVFSSILQTPLTIVHREGGASMFSRLEQLSQMLGIEEKIYGSPTFDFSRAGDYGGVPEAIDREREKFMNYLEDCLDAQLPGWREGARG